MSEIQKYLDEALKSVELISTEEPAYLEDYDLEYEVREMIIDVRTQLGMTQKQLSEKSGVSQANISKIENGSYRLSILTLKKIADGLGKRLVIELVDREEVF